MTTPAEYREYAAECLDAARLTMSEEIRATLLSMAQRWNDLAAKAERNAHLRGDAVHSSNSSRE